VIVFIGLKYAGWIHATRLYRVFRRVFRKEVDNNFLGCIHAKGSEAWLPGDAAGVLRMGRRKLDGHRYFYVMEARG
jgi:hypothetical protein